MLNCYNSSTQSAAVDAVLVYDTDQFNRGVATSHVSGSGVFTLNRPGVYLVKFNGVASAATAGTITAQLYQNGTKVNSAIGSASVSDATDVVGLNFETLIEVPMGCPMAMINNPTSLQVQNSGIAADYSLTNIVVIKVR